MKPPKSNHALLQEQYPQITKFALNTFSILIKIVKFLICLRFSLFLKWPLVGLAREECAFMRQMMVFFPQIIIQTLKREASKMEEPTVVVGGQPLSELLRTKGPDLEGAIGDHPLGFGLEIGDEDSFPGQHYSRRLEKSPYRTIRLGERAVDIALKLLVNIRDTARRNGIDTDIPARVTASYAVAYVYGRDFLTNPKKGMPSTRMIPDYARLAASVGNKPPLYIPQVLHVIAAYAGAHQLSEVVDFSHSPFNMPNRSQKRRKNNHRRPLYLGDSGASRRLPNLLEDIAGRLEMPPEERHEIGWGAIRMAELHGASLVDTREHYGYLTMLRGADGIPVVGYFQPLGVIEKPRR
jgi:hypothetical protein